MVKGQLIMAMDFQRRKGVEHGTVTWRKGDQWYVGQYGPTYENTHKVTEFDAEGLQWLEKHEDKPKSALLNGEQSQSKNDGGKADNVPSA